MMWNTGFGMGAGMWLVMAAGTVAFWVVVILGVRALLGTRRHSWPGADTVRGEPGVPSRGAELGGHAEGEGPLAVLQDRLARGEIDVDEYARIRRALVESQPSLAADAQRAGGRGAAPRA